MTIDFSELERSVLDIERLESELVLANSGRDENAQQILQQLKKGESTGIPFLDSSIFSSNSPFKKQKQLEEAAGFLAQSAGEYALIIEHTKYGVRTSGFPTCEYRDFSYKKATIGILDINPLREKKVQDSDFPSRIGYVITINFEGNQHIALSEARIHEGEREADVRLISSSNESGTYIKSPYWWTDSRDLKGLIFPDKENNSGIVTYGKDGKPHFEIYAGNQALLKCVAHLGITQPTHLCELYETIKSKRQLSPIFNGPDYVRKLEKLENVLDIKA